MKVLVYASDNGAVMVVEGSDDHDGVKELPHMKLTAEHECATIDDGIEWFRRWTVTTWGGFGEQLGGLLVEKS